MKTEILKKLNSICIKNSSLQILNYYKVKSGIFYYTDLDNWIVGKSEYKDGLYYKFKPDQKELALDPSQKIEDFPFLSLEKKTTKYVFNMEELDECIIHFVSKEPTRASLQSVFFSEKNQESCATDGHYIRIQKMSVKTDCIVPVSFIRLCKKLECSQVYIKGNFIFAENNGIEVYTKFDPELEYPNYTVAIPKNTKTDFTINDFQNFLSAINSLKDFWNERTKLIYFSGDFLCTYNKDKGVKINLNVGSIFPSTMYKEIGFNAGYLVDLIIKYGNGNMYYNPSRNITMVYFKSDTTLTGVMPFKVIEELPETYTEIKPELVGVVKEKKPDYKKMYFELLKKYNEVKK